MWWIELSLWQGAEKGDRRYYFPESTQHADTNHHREGRVPDVENVARTPTDLPLDRATGPQPHRMFSCVHGTTDPQEAVAREIVRRIVCRAGGRGRAPLDTRFQTSP